MREMLLPCPLCRSKLGKTREIQGSLYILLYHLTPDINHFFMGLLSRPRKGPSSHVLQPAAVRQVTSVPLCRLHLTDLILKTHV